MESYEKKYKEAQKWIESIYSELSHEQQMEAEAFFPELKESEDERIRKEIIETFKILGDGKIPVDINYADIFTWLEKQEGCEWDAKKKELKKIGQNIEMVEALRTEYEKGRADAIAQMQKEWNEEDETKMRSALAFIKSEFPKKGDEEFMKDTIAWLKSFKPRKQWKPSDEQINALDSTLQYSQVSHNSYEHLNSLYNDLKKLTE